LGRRLLAGLPLAVEAVALWGLGMYASLGAWSRFIADDYCVAYYAGHFGFLRSIWYWYITWSGGYATSIVDWLLVLIRPTGIPFVTPIVLLIWVALTAASIRILLPASTAPGQKIVASIVLGSIFVLVILLLSPDVPQSLYWWTGMRGYVAPLIVLTLWFLVYGLFERHLPTNGWLSTLWSLASFGILFVNGGFTETLSPAQFVLFLSVLVFAMVTGKAKWGSPRLYFLSAAALGALSSLIAMVVAPGNANRQAFYPAPPGLFTILSIGLRAYGEYLMQIFANPQKITALLAALLAAFWFGHRFRFSPQRSNWIPRGLGLAALVFSYGCFIPAAWGMSDNPPARTQIIPSFFLAVFFLGSAFTAGARRAPEPSVRDATPTSYWPLIVSLCLLVFAVYWNNWVLLATRSDYVSYAVKWDAINAQIVGARQSGESVVHIPSMDSWTTLDSPNDNPKYWLNICMSKFYGIQVLSP
jgi:hypothetical protein